MKRVDTIYRPSPETATIAYELFHPDQIRLGVLKDKIQLFGFIVPDDPKETLESLRSEKEALQKRIEKRQEQELFRLQQELKRAEEIVRSLRLMKERNACSDLLYEEALDGANNARRCLETFESIITCGE